jgi:hypothetical protein
LQIEETMRVRAFFVLAVAASLSLFSWRSGYPLAGAAGQELAAGAAGVVPPAPSPTAIPLHERAGRECGLNSLFLLLRLSGHHVTHEQVQAAVAVGPSGTSLLELQQAASRLGAKTLISRCSMAELLHRPKPVIAYFHLKTPGTQDRTGHYVVVLGTDETGVEVIDGTFATSFKYPASQFEAEWSGHILALAPPQTWVRPLALSAVLGLWVGIGLLRWRARVLRRAAGADSAAARGQPEGPRP